MTGTVAPRSASRLRRLDLRVVIGLALLLAGVVGTVGVVQRAGQRTPVLVVSVVAPDPDTAGDGKLLVSLSIPEDQAAALAQATHGTVDLVLLARAEHR